MNDDPATRFATLSSSQMIEVDRIVVSARGVIAAMKGVLDLLPGLSLSDAEHLVSLWLEALGADLTPPGPTLEGLRTKIGELGGLPLALEAVWDGDTVFNWFVILFAIVPDSGAERGMRACWLDRFVSRHGDPAAMASELGRVFADELAVPFFFASPHDPDDRAPRWWDSAKALSLSRT